MAFFATIGLKDIAVIMHIVVAVTMVDFILGFIVSLKKRGKNSIMSSKIRNSLIKVLFYILIVAFLYLIDRHVLPDLLIMSKTAAFIIIGTELWSIMANMLIIHPDIPGIRMIKNLLTKEMASKVGMEHEVLDKELQDNESRT